MFCELFVFRCFVNCFRAHQYVALKVYVHSSLVHRELPFYNHIAHRIEDSAHKGRSNIRKLLDSFDVRGPHGKHVTLVFEACQMSLRDSHGEIVHTGIMLLAVIFLSILIAYLFTLIP